MRRDQQKVVVPLVAAYVLVTIGFALYFMQPRVEYVPGPTVTATATIKVTLPPKTLPPVTVRATEPARASRNQVSRPAPSTTSRAGSSNVTLACIRKHESGNNYTAVSDSGTYRGAYQMSVQYSDDWARRAGYESWAQKPADKWPPAVQDAVAAHMGRGGWGHWSKWTSYSCPGF